MSVGGQVAMISVLWGQDSIDIADVELADAIRREADNDYASDNPLLEAVRGHRAAWNEAVRGQGPSADRPGFPKLVQPPLTSRLFNALLNLRLPAALNLQPRAKPDRVVVLRVRLDNISPHTLVWCLDGYRLYADHRINGPIMNRCVVDWSAVSVRGLDARWRALSYDRVAPVEDGHPKERRHFRLEKGGIYNRRGDLLREVRL